MYMCVSHENIKVVIQLTYFLFCEESTLMAMGELVYLNVMLVTLQEMRMESYTGISAYCSRKAIVKCV